MAQPLLELSGGSWPLARLSRAALVLIDCQREYVDGALPLPGIGPALEALEEAGQVLVRARRAGAPVVHVVHHSRPGARLFDPRGSYVEVAPEVRPRERESVVVKGLPNAFAGTELEEVLQQAGRGELIVAGFMTHMCVSSTVRSATDLGYRPTLVDAAVATRELPDGRGGTIPAELVHRASLAELADRFAAVANDSDSISRIRGIR